MRTLGLFCILLLAGISSARAETIVAAGGDWASVSNAVAISDDGDVVIVPASTNTWVGGLYITNKFITLRGAAKWGYFTNGFRTWTNAEYGVMEIPNVYITNYNAENTVIIDEIANRGGGGDSLIFMDLYTNSAPGVQTNQIFWLTGFEFRGGVTNTAQNTIGTIRVRASNFDTNNTRWRWSYNYHNQLKGRPWVYAHSGLIDHMVIDQGGLAGIGFDGRTPDSYSKGHEKWSIWPRRVGTVDEGVFIEDSYFTNTTINGFTDGFCAASYIARFVRTDAPTFQNHGTDSTAEMRGTRWSAIYGSILTSPLSSDASIHFRSGSGVIVSNTVLGAFPYLFRPLNYRLRDNQTPYQPAIGTNVWDKNYTNLFDSGTHTGGDSTVMTDSGKSWTNGGLVGFSIINTTTGKGGEIQTNTATTITCFSGINLPSWTNGHTYEIRKVDLNLDCIGCGNGDELSGGNTTTPPTPTTWPNQTNEPVYIWANEGITNLNISQYVIIEGRNYSNAVSPWYAFYQYPHEYLTQTESGGGTNTWPTISNIGNTSTYANTPTLPIAFTISDEESEPEDLALTGYSSDTSILPVNHIVFSGSSSNRFVTLSPTNNLTGSVTVTVRVTDPGALYNEDQFTLTVNENLNIRFPAPLPRLKRR